MQERAKMEKNQENIFVLNNLDKMRTNKQDFNYREKAENWFW